MVRDMEKLTNLARRWLLPSNLVRKENRSAFLNQERILIYSRLFILLYVAIMAYWYSSGSGLLDRTGKPIGADFLGFYSASLLISSGDPTAVYNVSRITSLQQEIVGVSFPLPWYYPPTFFLFIIPLSLLPYLLSLIVWIVVTFFAYYLVVRWIAPHYVATWLLFAFPGTFQNIIHGQNGFLSTALLGGSVLLIDRRPGVAGIMLGLLLYKPHMALVAGLAFIVSRRWQALASTATTVVCLSLLSILFFGYEPWGDFFYSLSQKAKVLESGAVPWFKVTTTFCALRLAGASINVALATHATVALGAIVVTLWVWIKKKTLALRGSTLIVATLLATPHAHSYDLSLLALPLSWLGWEGYTKGWLRWEKPVLAACWLSPLIAPTLAQISNLQIAPLALIALLIFALQNDSRSLPETTYL